ncbi:MAG: hypothetical protein UR28_C0019G0024 [Candidatus Peregrinibacteria bacterium GW2011_GWF2_33_10]|nr:MAG: hypothetical protein UR28_C0019G0024 [Candidatus Peregrinibacteria bacterium GW2011_GWF2_33_10]OGJ43987.1 MAG: hypothetical protein A2272_05135 [Candidatus Peregrinibacteria bacterium RIFOXYA12_FULL_33_12]OGJ45515.1 MAG: hypothetical protein A2263_05950 [Candidatus Peregrinibacteria bacterium RIFOXYA2_FULL_33_21]OGJ50010.1 MAG: hypothetical protein A2307_04550 [Candidatus Peregrinibacteria bacterium RIFOXYB2_FULL_33_20]
MKKFVVLSVLSVLIVFLEACSQAQTNQPVTQVQDQPDTQTQDLTYTNSEYGFTLTIPSTWEDYTTKSGPKADGKSGTSDSVAFSLPSQSPLFVVYIYPIATWENVQKEEGPIPTYLEENNEYAFAYSMTQDAKNETMVARISEIKDILKTFKLIIAEPLSYSITGVTATVSKETKSFNYSKEQLEAMADECGTEHSDPNYFEFLISQFKNTTKTIYNFKYTGASQQSDTFIVSLLPNKGGYSSIEQFKKDFDICSAGGSEYPKMLNDNWLVFVNSCGTGFDDGTDKLNGCQEVKDIVEQTLKLT